MSTIAKEVSELIRDVRKAEGLTQKELGLKMGIGESAVNKLEGGSKHPTILTLENVANALGKRLKITFE